MQRNIETRDIGQFLEHLACAVCFPRHKRGGRNSIEVNGEIKQIDSGSFGSTYEFNTSFDEKDKQRFVYRGTQVHSFDDDPFNEKEYIANFLEYIEKRVSDNLPHAKSLGIKGNTLTFESIFKTLQDSLK